MTSHYMEPGMGTLMADLRLDRRPGDDLNRADADDDVFCAVDRQPGDSATPEHHPVDKAGPAMDTVGAVTGAGQQTFATAMGLWQSRLQEMIASELGVGSTRDGCQSSIGATAFDLEQHRAANHAPPVTSDGSRRPEVPLCRLMPESEMAELEELEQSYAKAFGALVDRLRMFTEQGISGIELWVLRAKASVGSLRQFFETLPEFACLPRNVRSALMKAASSGGLLLTAAQVYAPTHDQDPLAKVYARPSDIDGFVRAFPDADPQLWIRHLQLAHEFRELIPPRSFIAASASTAASSRESADIVVYALLHAIVALSPEHGILAEDEDQGSSCDRSIEDINGMFAQISDGQQHYMLLLRHYLEARHSFVRAADMLPELLQRIAEYKLFAVYFRRAMTTSEAFYRDPVLLEVLNC